MIIFFDSDCVLCNRLVHFLIKIDSREKLHYAIINGETFLNLKLTNIDALIFYNQDETSYKALAVIDILKVLGGKYKVFGIFLSIFPAEILNLLYDIIAKNRYRFFGKTSHCALLSDADKKKILP